MRYAWFGIGSALLLLISLAPISAQMGGLMDDDTPSKGPGGETGGGTPGPVGNTDAGTEANAEEELIPDWEDLTDPQWGLAGVADERQAHAACEWCFTVPGDEDSYQIYEYVDGDGEEAVILSRPLPHPAPLGEGETRPTVDEDGEPIWYIGTQGFVGETDETMWSESLQFSYIELQRIQERHLNTIMNTAGVHGFGIGENGFVVTILPTHDTDTTRAAIPTTLETVPVSIEVRSIAVSYGHQSAHKRPLPAGVGIGTSYLDGTLGPHVVRDTPNVSTCCKFWVPDGCPRGEI